MVAILCWKLPIISFLFVQTAKTLKWNLSKKHSLLKRTFFDLSLQKDPLSPPPNAGPSLRLRFFGEVNFSHTCPTPFALAPSATCTKHGAGSDSYPLQLSHSVFHRRRGVRSAARHALVIHRDFVVYNVGTEPHPTCSCHMPMRWCFINHLIRMIISVCRRVEKNLHTQHW